MNQEQFTHSAKKAAYELLTANPEKTTHKTKVEKLS